MNPMLHGGEIGRPARSQHWDAVHAGREPSSTSWFDPTSAASLDLLDVLGAVPSDPIVDVGAGASGLAGPALDNGFRDVTALDVSAAALDVAAERLGDRAGQVTWLVADLLNWLPERRYRIWHDRAVFHFLTRAEDRAHYRTVLDAAVEPGGGVIVGTFASDGPQACSGLPTCCYDANALAAALGDGLEVVAERRAEHRTPAGAVQPFTWLSLRRC